MEIWMGNALRSMNIAMENDAFVDDLPIKKVEFPLLCPITIGNEEQWECHTLYVHE